MFQENRGFKNESEFPIFSSYIEYWNDGSPCPCGELKCTDGKTNGSSKEREGNSSPRKIPISQNRYTLISPQGFQRFNFCITYLDDFQTLGGSLAIKKICNSSTLMGPGNDSNR